MNTGWIGSILTMDAAVILPVAVFVLFMVLRQRSGLENQLAFMKDAMDVYPQGMVLFDAREDFCFANAQAAKYLPFLADLAKTPQNLRGFLDYFYDHAAEFDQGLAGALGRTAEGQPPQGFREVIQWGHNKYCLIEAKKSAHGLSALILSDVSHSKKHEEHVIRLNEQNFELSQAIEAATNGIVITNPLLPDRPVVFANAAFCEYIGKSRDRVVGQNIDKIVGKFGRSEMEKVMGEAFEQAQAVDVEIETGQNYALRWFNLKLTPVKDENGKVVMFVGVLTETTSLKMHEAELAKAQKLEALAQMAAGVAHDFNNVLSIMSGYLRLAESNIGDQKKMADFLDKIKNSINRAVNITQQILTFGRHQVVLDSVIDLSVVIKEQETFLRPLLDASVKVSIRSELENAYVECSSDSIVQIIMNLAVNARDAMPEGGRLTITLSVCEVADIPADLVKSLKGKHFVRLDVVDTGCGMDRATQERMFDPFFTTKGQGKGTGLGLSMVYGLVRQMGGGIGVQSVPEKGTTISIFLPLTDKRPRKRIEGTLADINSINLSGYTALVAEDEPDLLILVSDMLEKLGMKVLRAANGNEALLVQDDYLESIDILITDVVMPELNGIKLAELLEALRPEIKVIFMSGYPAGGDLARIEIPEGACFLAKPIRYEDLAHAIFERLAGRQKTAEDDAGLISASPHWQPTQGDRYG